MRVAALALLLLAPTTSAATGEPPALASRVVRVATWKNGLASVTREVRMPERPGTYAFEMPSQPLHGTLWLALPPKARVTEIVAQTRESRDSLLAAACEAIGRTITVERSGDQPPVTGRLVWAPCDQPAAQADPWQPQPAQGLLRLADGDTVVSLPLSAANALRVQGGDVAPAPAGPRATIAFESVAGAAFEVTWMTRGVAWAPAARLELESPTRGTLSASAVLVNDAEDLAGVAVDLVSGPARFAMGNVASPLALPSLTAFFQALSGRGSGYDVHVIGMQNVGYVGGAGGHDSSAAGSAAAGVEVAAEDASLRRVDDVTLAKGASSYRPLWSDAVALEHVYRWVVPSTRMLQRSGSDRDEAKGPQHVVRLRNGSANPWTSQPIEILSGGTVVGQAKLGYTPAGAPADVTIADALDLVTEDAEVETQREQVENDGTGWRAWLTGTLVVENRAGHDVMLEVSREIEGDLLGSDPPAQATKLGQGLHHQNPRQELAWRLPLKAGEKLVMTYSYSTRL